MALMLQRFPASLCFFSTSRRYFIIRPRPLEGAGMRRSTR
jgi:hypothetical protein